MGLSRRHLLADGIRAVFLTLASFGIFFVVAAQAFSLPDACVGRGLTDPLRCKGYMESVEAAGSRPARTDLRFPVLVGGALVAAITLFAAVGAEEGKKRGRRASRLGSS